MGTLDELEGEFASHKGEPRGTVRVAASSVIAQYELVPSLPALAARHPHLKVELLVGDRLVDMAREGIDIAIRTVQQLPETVVARRIGTLGRALYAAPSYVAAHGLPAKPDELAGHELVTNNAVTLLNEWPFKSRGRSTVFTAEGRWRTSDTNMAASMVLQGLGIGRLATLVGDALVREKRLVPVLRSFVDLGPVPIYAVTSGTVRHRLPKIRACLDHWAAWFERTKGREKASA
jgi:DNA-binding transcriptional LysR family regulator